jgi:hypothetical protein
MNPSLNRYVGFSAILFLIFTLCWSAFMMLPAIDQFYKTDGLDLMFDSVIGLTGTDINNLLNATTPKGRKILVSIYRFEDFVFPMIYGPFLCTAIFYSIRKKFPTHKIYLLLLLSPFIMVLFDYLENFSIIHVVECYPTQAPMANFIGIFTTIKMILGLICILMILIPLTSLVVKKFRMQEK